VSDATPIPPDPAPDDAYALFRRGLDLIDGGHWPQAAVPLEKAKRLEPDKTSIREALGRAYFRSGRYRQAATEFAAVVEHSPVNDYAHFCLGRSLEMVGDHAAARRHLKLAYGMRPDRTDYRLYFERAQAA
jgi:tetratricopeptide (TPR) repeat protein